MAVCGLTQCKPAIASKQTFKNPLSRQAMGQPRLGCTRRNWRNSRRKAARPAGAGARA